MQYFQQKLVDRQVGRNAELFARSIAALDSTEKRYPYLRILISIVEQAHPEWGQAPTKDHQIAGLIHILSDQRLDVNEIAEIVRLRDAERGFAYNNRSQPNVS